MQRFENMVLHADTRGPGVIDENYDERNLALRDLKSLARPEHTVRAVSSAGLYE